MPSVPLRDAELAAAAAAEVASRDKHYPARVASRKMTADEATLDFQCWHMIAHWLETGRFLSGNIAAADARADLSDIRVVVDWLLCEQAADRAVVSTSQALNDAAESGDSAKADRLGVRLDALRQIARQVGQQRRTVEMLNRALRDRRDAQRKKEAA
jgi:hypothetical protein